MPKLFILARNSKSSPVPSIVIVGATLYPLPPLIIETLVTTPSSITGSSCALDARTVPTNLNSSSVSIALSYFLDISLGIGSLSNNESILTLSTIS